MRGGVRENGVFHKLKVYGLRCGEKHTEVYAQIQGISGRLIEVHCVAVHKKHTKEYPGSD